MTQKYKWFLVFGLAVCLAWAQGTGRITGRVLDVQTGEALVGADVVVEGVTGAAADPSGRYLIINIPVGTYDVTASMQGYGPKKISGIAVILDQTATVDFKLGSTVIPITKPIEIKGQRPMVIRTAVQTTRVVTSEEFKNLPVTSLTDLVGLQAGVTWDSRTGWTHIRGGRFDDVAYFINGVVAQDAIYGTIWSSPQPTTDAIQEMTIVTGGFDAEYGQAMAGIIQVETKEGGERTAGTLKYTTDEMFPKPDYNFGYNFYQATLGGSILKKALGEKKLRYFFSSQLSYVDDNYNILYKVPHSDQKQIGIDGKLTFKPAINTKLTVDGHADRKEWDWFSNDWRYWLDHYPGNRVRSWQTNFSLNQQFGSNTVLTAKLGYFNNDFIRTVRNTMAEKADTSGFWGFLRKSGIWERQIYKAEDFVFGKENPYYYNYQYGDSVYNDTIYDPVDPKQPADPKRRVQDLYLLTNLFVPPEYTTNNPYGLIPAFVGKGDANLFHYRSTEDALVKADLTYNPSKLHELKTGIDLTYYTLTLYENQGPWDPNPFGDGYIYHPITGAVYLQDRADFEDLVMRMGIRLDYLDANAWKRLYPDSLLRQDTVKVDMKFRFSPRFGFSFPITDRIKYRFSYGHFYQTPKFVYLYESLHANLLLRANNLVGQPDLGAEKTIAYETGFDAQLSDVFEFDLTLYYKDIYDLIGARTIAALPTSYSIYENVEYAKVQGFEATFSKQISHYWGAKLTYTFQIAKGTASDAWAQYGRAEPRQVDYYLGYDQRHALNLTLQFALDSAYLVRPMRDMQISMVSAFGTGLPYTPTDLKGNRIGDENSGRMPNSFNIDGRLSKKIKLAGLNLTLYCDVYNLLNIRNIRNVYAATGVPWNDGQEIFEQQYTLPDVAYYRVGDLYYHPNIDVNHDGYVSRHEVYENYLAYRRDVVGDPSDPEKYPGNPGNYEPPRKIRFGIGFSF
jgi:outer membrane receptor for ferrienterochelin and colicin